MFIINGHAGGGKAAHRVEALLRDLARPGEELKRVYTERRGHGAEIAEQAAASYETLVAVGGDGTVNEVATGLLRSGRGNVSLAILPLGTGNDVAQTLGIGEWREAVAALRGPGRRVLDVCEVCSSIHGGRRRDISLLWGAVGFPAATLRRTTPRVKRTLGHWSYLYATITGAFSYRCPQMRVRVDDQCREERLLLCAVANMEWTAGHSVRVAPGARWDDGQLDVVLVKEARGVRLLSRLRRFARGGHAGMVDVAHFPARSIRVESSPGGAVLVDGDLVGETPVQFTVLPGALKVRVP